MDKPKTTAKRATRWAVLDSWAIYLAEFTAALSTKVPTIGFHPVMGKLAALQDYNLHEDIDEPSYHRVRFPLQHGHNVPGLHKLTGEPTRMLRRLTETIGPEGVLLCTAQNYANVARRWKGPVVYYLTDMGIEYPGANRWLVRTLDRTLCDRADLSVPQLNANSYVPREGSGMQRIENPHHPKRNTSIEHTTPACDGTGSATR